MDRSLRSSSRGRTARWRAVSGLVLVLALVAAACGDDDDAAGPTATTATTAGTGSEPSGDLGPGSAGIASKPREIAGLFELDDGDAVFKERPASDDRTGVTDDEILIGKHTPLTGPLAPIAMTSLIQVLFDEVNEAGGIHGRKLVMEDRDSAANPALATQVVRELVEEVGVFGLFAAQITAAHLAVLPYLESKGIPDWSPNSSVPQIGEPPAPTRFATLPPSQLDAHLAADFLFNDEGADKVALIYQNDDFGKAWLEPLRKVAKDSGGEVVEISFELASSSDLTSQVQQAANANPDWIVIQSQFPQFSQMFTALRGAVGSRIPVYGAPAAVTGIQAGAKGYDGLVTGEWSYTAGDADNQVVKTLLELLRANGISTVTVAAPVLFQTESFFRALTLAGPDLTREGFEEAANVGFDGSWSCSVCFGPMIYGPEDHWGIETLSLATWSDAKGTWEHTGDPVSYETSDNKGLRALFPELAGK